MRRRDIDGFGGAARQHLRWGCHLHQPKAQDLAELQQGIRVATHEVLLVLNLTAAAEARAHDGARLVVTRQFEVKLLRVELGPQAPSPRQRRWPPSANVPGALDGHMDVGMICSSEKMRNQRHKTKKAPKA